MKGKKPIEAEPSLWDRWQAKRKEADNLLASYMDAIAEIKELALEIGRTINIKQVLTAREAQIHAMIKRNPQIGNKEIAWELHVTERTVKFHVTNILLKFHVKTRYEL